MTHSELCAVLNIQNEINRLRPKLDDIRQAGGWHTTSTDIRVMGGEKLSAGQIAAEIQAQIDDLDKRKLSKMLALHECIEASELTDIESRIIRLRYAECWPWESIMFAIGYSKSRTYKFHEMALQKLMEEAPQCPDH